MERDELAVSKNDMVKIMLANQVHIESRLVELAKSDVDGAGMDFRALKNTYLQDWRQMKRKIQVETGMKTFALSQGKDPEEFIKQRNLSIANAQEKGQKMRKVVIGIVIAIVAYKKLFK